MALAWIAKRGKRAGRCRPGTWAFVLAVVLLGSKATHGQEIINRRDEARGMFLATPQGIYGHYCAHCHGEDATGSGRLWPSELSPRPANLTSLDADEAQVIAAIRDGSAAGGKSNLCPPWGRTISAADTTRLARYIVSLGSNAPSLPPALAIPPKPIEEPFPWGLVAVLLVEVALVGWMLRPKTNN